MSAIATTAYDAEMRTIEADIEALRPQALDEPFEVESATKYAYRLYQRASLSGDLRQFREAERAIDAVIARLERPDDLQLLRANLCFKLHRLYCVRRIFADRPDLRETEEGRKLDADLLFQEGRYGEARDTYLRAIDQCRSWDNLARYAHFLGKFEGANEADQLYAEAEDELTSKQMRSFAWIRLQRGALELERGRYDEAASHYATAERAYPGYWMVAEHRAGLLARQGRYEGAAAEYRELAEGVAKPELWQTLGDLYRHMGAHDRAESWHNRALAAFEESAARGEVHYYHHLVDFHCAVTKRPAEAVRWAQKDVELRNNFSTQAALAWALHLDGKPPAALEWLEKALASGVRDAHLFSHASAIYDAAGDSGRAHDYRHRARALNPRGEAVFHTHHH
jgi:tetratricopeptide (TPR) repeat protein